MYLHNIHYRPHSGPHPLSSSLPWVPGNSRRTDMHCSFRGYDAEPAQPPSGAIAQSRRPTNGRTQCWHLSSGGKGFEPPYEEFDSRNVNESHLAFADGDAPKNKVRSKVVLWRLIELMECTLSSLYRYLLIRWMCQS